MASAAVLLTGCGPEGSAVDPRAPGVRPPLLGSAKVIYVDPNNAAAQWLRTAPTNAQSNLIRTQIAARPSAKTFAMPAEVVTESVAGYVGAAEKAAAPVVVADSDAAGTCPGGTTDAAVAAHREWFADFVRGIGQASVLVVVRAGNTCLSLGAADVRARVLADAVHTLKQATNAILLLDVTDEAETSSAAATALLVAADVRETAGFVINIGEYASDAKTVPTVRSIRAGLRDATGRED
jgi:endoglucanase